MKILSRKVELEEKGFSILEDLYSNVEVDNILECIEGSTLNKNSHLTTNNLFAIRQLFNNIPQLKNLVLNKKLINLIAEISPSEYFVTKAIYFDKPIKSNWFVAYHQDLSISVNQKTDAIDYTNWTFKKGQYGVQPPSQILEDTITLRIHLDSTDKDNGALRVIPKSHLKGVIRHESEDWKLNNEQICNVKRGGVMLMKPLTLHSSKRTTNNKRRRVIHIEFNKHSLIKPLKWLEYHKL